MLLRISRSSTSLAWMLWLLAPTRSVSAADNPKIVPSLTHECPAGFRGKLNSEGFTACTLPKDDSTTSGSDPETWAPWTHRPFCLNSTRNEGKTKYCVYTNANHGPHGLSIITTPEHAASSLYLMEDPNLPKLHRNETLGSPWQVVDMAGKGKGVVATRKIRRFEIFMLEYAALATDNSFPSSVKRLDGYDLLHEAVNRLREPDRVLSLARSNPYAADIVEDVLRTNSFAGELDGDPHMALFPGISRMNHACKPNAFTRFSRRSMATAVVAARDIEPGEEIVISYAALGLHYEERQERLKTWGFQCTCDFCSLPSSKRAISDQRRKDIQQKRKDVVKSIDSADAATAIRLSNEILDLLASEDLPALFAEQYEVLARVYQAVGYGEKAAKYAKMALTILDIYGNLDPDEEYTNLERLLASFEKPRFPAMGRPTEEDKERERRMMMGGGE